MVRFTYREFVVDCIFEEGSDPSGEVTVTGLDLRVKFSSDTASIPSV